MLIVAPDIEALTRNIAELQSQLTRATALTAAQRTRIAELEGELVCAKVRIVELEEALARAKLGNRSERFRVPASEAIDRDAQKQDPGEPRQRGQRRGAPGHGRRDYRHLPIREETLQPDPKRLVCSWCGRPYRRLGEDSCSQIEWQWVLRRHVVRRPGYVPDCGCPGKRGIVQEPPPAEMLPGLLSIGFIVRILIMKFEAGIPIHRILMLLRLEGLDLPTGSVPGILRRVAELMRALAEEFYAHNRESPYLHIDDTGWRMLFLRDGNRWWRLHVFEGPDSCAYQIRPTKSAQELADYLKIDLDSSRPALSEGRSLVIHCDRAAQFKRLARLVPEIAIVFCWLHQRRPLFSLRDRHPELRPWAETWLTRIRGFLGSYQRWCVEPDGPEGEKVLELIEQMRVNKDEQLKDPSLGAPALKWLKSLHQHWTELSEPFTQPHLEPTNNRAERAQRKPIVGRKNFYGSGSEASAQLAASLWTILATVRMAGWDLAQVLQRYLEACARNGGKPLQGEALSPFMPWTASPEQAARLQARPADDTS